jgi:hypothetical protein
VFQNSSCVRAIVALSNYFKVRFERGLNNLIIVRMQVTGPVEVPVMTIWLEAVGYARLGVHGRLRIWPFRFWRLVWGFGRVGKLQLRLTQ